MSESKPVVLQHLTKYYGHERGIDDVTFSIDAGEVLGFLGPNGAGKTTTIRTLVGLIRATSGSAELLGDNALRANATLRARIGYLPGVFEIYPSYTAKQALRFCARMRGLDCNDVIETLAERLRLDLHRHIHDLSKGNRQKVGVIQAFMHAPDVLLLDEPTAGLDPLAQREFEEILEEAKQRGASVLLSSHVLSEVEHLADRVAVISEGRVIVVERIANLKAKAPRRVHLSFDTPIQQDAFRSVSNMFDLDVHGRECSATVIGAETELLAEAVQRGVTSVRTEEARLDEIFLDLVGSGSRP
mgnify:CR=1 FL=1